MKPECGRETPGLVPLLNRAKVGQLRMFAIQDSGPQVLNSLLLCLASHLRNGVVIVSPPIKHPGFVAILCPRAKPGLACFAQCFCVGQPTMGFSSYEPSTNGLFSFLLHSNHPFAQSYRAEDPREAGLAIDPTTCPTCSTSYF
jgi:hypothetical protein